MAHQLLFLLALLSASLSAQLLDESFEGDVFPPTNWAESEINGVWQSTPGGSDGAKAAISTGGNFFNPYFTNTLFSSAVMLTAGTEYTVEFDVSTNFAANLSLQIGTSQDDLGATTDVEIYLNEVFRGAGLFSFTTELATITVATTGTYYLHFTHFSNPENPAGGNLTLDHVRLYESPPCPKPTDVVVTPPPNSTAFQALDLAWLERGTAAQWEITYDTDPGFDPTTGGQSVVVSTNPATVTPLMENTDYTFYIRALCGGVMSDYSPNAAAGTTECNATLAPYTESAEDGSERLRCWEFEDNNNDNLRWGILFDGDGGLPRTGANAFEFSPSFFNPTGAHDDYLISAPLLTTGDEVLEFYYQTTGDVTFSVLLAEIIPAPGSFNDVLAPTTTYSASGGYVRQTYDLSAFSGTVWIAWRVTQTVGDAEGEVQLLLDDISLLEPPANDDCIDAAPIVDDVTYDNRTGKQGSPTITGACGGSDDDDVWFSYTAVSDDPITINVIDEGSANLVLEIFAGGDCGALTSVFCGGEGANQFTPTGGTDYLLRVYDGGAPSPRGAAVNEELLQPFSLIIGDASLPVQLAEFTGRAERKHNRLSWLTLTEENTDRFAVEYSADGRNWADLASVAAAGNSAEARAYTYLHYGPDANAYYRLGIEDLDGSVAFSPVVRISRANTATPLIVQNPVNGELRLAIPASPGRAAHLHITNMSGRVIYDRVLPASEHPSRMTVNLRSQPSGIYVVTHEAAGGRISERVLKL